MIVGCSGSEEVLYTITFDTAGGTSVSSITQESDSPLSPPVEPQREGYRFTGWSPQLPSRMPSDNINLVAQWQANQYTITFDSSGGSIVSSITQNFDYSINVDDPSKEGHTFIGWNPEMPDRMPSENITLTAEWEINEYLLNKNLITDIVDVKTFCNQVYLSNSINQVYTLGENNKKQWMHISQHYKTH